MASVQVNGLAELGRALQQFPIVLGQKYLRRATYTAAAVIEQEVENRVPVRTGELKSHVTIFRHQMTDLSCNYDVGVRGIRLTRKVKRLLRVLRKTGGLARVPIQGDSYYWRFLEFGTAKMAAKPFLRPAFEATKDNAVDVFRTTLADGVIAAAAEVSQ